MNINFYTVNFTKCLNFTIFTPNSISTHFWKIVFNFSYNKIFISIWVIFYMLGNCCSKFIIVSWFTCESSWHGSKYSVSICMFVNLWINIEENTWAIFLTLFRIRATWICMRFFEANLIININFFKRLTLKAAIHFWFWTWKSYMRRLLFYLTFPVKFIDNLWVY